MTEAEWTARGRGGPNDAPMLNEYGSYIEPVTYNQFLISEINRITTRRTADRHHEEFLAARAKELQDRADAVEKEKLDYGVGAGLSLEDSRQAHADWQAANAEGAGVH